MRRALGLRDDSTPRDTSAGSRPIPEPRPGVGPVIQRREADRRTRRFVRDGEVPVVVLNGSREHGPDAPAPVNRLAATESALATERTARERADRSLHEALATIQHLQTQVAHANLAHGEALAAERHARMAAEEACAAANVARDAAEAKAEALEARLIALETAPEPAPKPQATRRARRVADIDAAALPAEPEAEPEPEPVKWWLPSYKAKRRKG